MKDIQRLLDRAEPADLTAFFDALGTPEKVTPPEAILNTVLSGIAPTHRPDQKPKKKRTRAVLLIAAALTLITVLLAVSPLFFRAPAAPPTDTAGTESDTGSTPAGVLPTLHAVYSGKNFALRLDGDGFELYRRSDTAAMASDETTSGQDGDAALSDLGGGVSVLRGQVIYKYSGPLYAPSKIIGITIDPGGENEESFTVSGETGRGEPILFRDTGEILTPSYSIPDWVALRKFGGAWYCAGNSGLLFIGPSLASWTNLTDGTVIRGTYTVEIATPSEEDEDTPAEETLCVTADGEQELRFVLRDGTLFPTEENEGDHTEGFRHILDYSSCEVLIRSDAGTLPVGFMPFSAAAGDSVFLSVLPPLASAEPSVSLGEVAAFSLDRVRFPGNMKLTVMDAWGRENVMAAREFVSPTAPGNYLLRLEYTVSTDASVKLGLYADIFFTIADGTTETDFEYRILGAGTHAKILITGYKGTDRDLVIPETVHGIPVSEVNFDSFDKSAITSLTIPDTVCGAFNLTDFPLLSRVNSDTEGVCAVPAGFTVFGAARTPLIREIVFSPGSVCEGVYGISDMASLVRFTLPDGVITPPTVENCPMLIEAHFGNGITKLVTSIGGCPALVCLTLGKHVTVVRVTFGEGQPIPELRYPCTRRVWEAIDVADRNLLTPHVTFGTSDEIPTGYVPPRDNFAAVLLWSDYRYLPLAADFGHYDGTEFRMTAPENPLNFPQEAIGAGTRLQIDFATEEKYGFSDYKQEYCALKLFLRDGDEKGAGEHAVLPDLPLSLTFTERGCVIDLSPLADYEATQGKIIELILICSDAAAGNAVRIRLCF